MKRHPEEAQKGPSPALLERVYDAFRLEEAGVARGDFSSDPALHLRNLSRRLRAGAEPQVMAIVQDDEPRLDREEKVDE